MKQLAALCITQISLLELQPCDADLRDAEVVCEA